MNFLIFKVNFFESQALNRNLFCFTFCFTSYTRNYLLKLYYELIVEYYSKIV